MNDSVDRLDTNRPARSLLIIGAGISGLICAKRISELWNEKGTGSLQISIVDGRDRIGGRLLASKSGVDLGAAWSWPGHDKELQSLAAELGVRLEPQRSEGIALSQAADGRVGKVGRDIGPAGPGSTRFEGGAASIAAKLAQVLQRDRSVTFHLSTQVRKITIDDAREGAVLAEGTALGPGATPFALRADAAVLAMPPRLIAATINFSPELRAEKREAMAGTPTWMEDTGKAVFVYTDRFWAAAGLSGTAFSDRGPLRQARPFVTHRMGYHSVVCAIPRYDKVQRVIVSLDIAPGLGQLLAGNARARRLRLRQRSGGAGGRRRHRASRTPAAARRALRPGGRRARPHRVQVMATRPHDQLANVGRPCRTTGGCRALRSPAGPRAARRRAGGVLRDRDGPGREWPPQRRSYCGDPGRVRSSTRTAGLTARFGWAVPGRGNAVIKSFLIGLVMSVDIVVKLFVSSADCSREVTLTVPSSCSIASLKSLLSPHLRTIPNAQERALYCASILQVLGI